MKYLILVINQHLPNNNRYIKNHEYDCSNFNSTRYIKKAKTFTVLETVNETIKLLNERFGETYNFELMEVYNKKEVL